MDKEMMFDVKIDYCREELISNLESLIKNCQYELNRLKKEKDYKPNSLGIIQYSKIDLLCKELYTLHEGKDIAMSE